jgi:hypothetical protein
VSGPWAKECEEERVKMINAAPTLIRTTFLQNKYNHLLYNDSVNFSDVNDN